jgi:signal peptidase II
MSEMTSGRRMYFGVAGLVVCLDQITKALVDRYMALYESRSIVDGLLKLTYVQNRGAAFGILSDADLPNQSWLLAVVSLCALAAIAYYAWKLPAGSRMPRLALALIMGGAVGNLLDRLRLGHVVDFVDVYWGAHHWPAFNVADSAISVGVALLLLDILRHPQGEAQAEAPAAGPGE